MVGGNCVSLTPLIQASSETGRIWQASSQSPLYPWLAPWEHADALWFKYIVLTGYRAGDGSVHFLPVFPLVTRLLMPVFLDNFWPCGSRRVLDCSESSPLCSYCATRQA